MTDITAIYREDATEQEQIEAFQALINNGQVWRLEGSMGRAAMDLIESGICALGHEGCHDYWGNYTPSRTEVEPGTKGSVEYVEEHGNTVLDPPLLRGEEG